MNNLLIHRGPSQRIIAMHDLCAYGRCSFTVIIPVLSVLNCQVCPIPTAFFSAHLGYPETCIFDIGNGLKDILKHWNSLNLQFDCFYSGYFYNSNQIDIATMFIDQFKPKLVFIDPVLGDNGLLYKGTNTAHIDAMRCLIAHADMISPNITEACLLLNEEIRTCLEETMAIDFLSRLKKLGPSYVCITGVLSFDDKFILNYACDHDKFYMIKYPKVPLQLSGTGDCFAATLVGLSLNGFSFDNALMRAATFLGTASNLAYQYNTDLCVESALMNLISGDLTASITYLN